MLTALEAPSQSDPAALDLFQDSSHAGKCVEPTGLHLGSHKAERKNPATYNFLQKQVPTDLRCLTS